MMSFDSFLVFHVLLLLASFCYSLSITKIQVPSVIDVRDKAVLSCTFELEGESLYSFKWYKEELEFFRYTPGLSPHIQTFIVQGVNLVIDKSNISSIMLYPLEYKSTGLYRCEVSTEGPHFKVVYANATMAVLGLPKEDPIIEGVQSSYSAGSYVSANCTSSPSHPAARMDWYINGVKAQHWLLSYYYTESKEENVLDLETRTVGLKFQAEESHFQRKDRTLSLICSATVADRTRSRETKAYLSTITKEKLAQLNNSARSTTRCFLLIVLILLQL